MMKKIIALIITGTVLFAMPVHSGVIKDMDPVEKEFLNQPKANDDFQKRMNKSEQQKVQTQASGSTWWKWALGAVVVGGVVAASYKDSKSAGAGGETTTVTGSW